MFVWDGAPVDLAASASPEFALEGDRVPTFSWTGGRPLSTGASGGQGCVGMAGGMPAWADVDAGVEPVAAPGETGGGGARTETESHERSPRRPLTDLSHEEWLIMCRSVAPESRGSGRPSGEGKMAANEVALRHCACFCPCFCLSCSSCSSSHFRRCSCSCHRYP